MDRQVDVAIIGAGTAGLSALAEVRRATDNVVVIDGGPLGTVCARVGCMPSKVLIQVASDFHRRRMLAPEGIIGADAMALDRGQAFAHVRALRDRFVSSVIEETVEPLGDMLIREQAEFLEPGYVQAGPHRIRARAVIVATGSSPAVPKPWQRFGDRILTTDTLFEQTDLPARMAVIGMGPVGVELGQALSRMGVAVTAFDMLAEIGGISDPAINALACKVFRRDMTMHLGDQADIEEQDGELVVRTEDACEAVDKLLIAVGRPPNLKSLRLDRLGIRLDDRGLPPIDAATMQVGDLPVFMAGDVTGGPAILHEASHDGRVAGYNAVRSAPVRFQRPPLFGIAFCEPNVCSVGARWSDLDEADIAVGEASVDAGRAIIMLQDEGLIRVYADRATGVLRGAALIAPHGEHLAHLLAWSIQRKLTVFELLEMPFYHPVIEEALQSALRDAARTLEQGVDRPLGLARA